MALADEIVAPNHPNSGPAALPGLPNGPEGGRILVATYRTAFPDIHFTVDEQIAEGDMVVTFAGQRPVPRRANWQGIPPTGKSATVTGVIIDRFANGMIAQTWAIFDQFGMLQQLGLIPSPGSPDLKEVRSGKCCLGNE